MSCYVAHTTKEGDWPFTESDSEQEAARKLIEAHNAKRVLIDPRSRWTVVKLDEPPRNEDR